MQLIEVIESSDEASSTLFVVHWVNTVANNFYVFWCHGYFVLLHTKWNEDIFTLLKSTVKIENTNSIWAENKTKRHSLLWHQKKEVLCCLIVSGICTSGMHQSQVNWEVCHNGVTLVTFLLRSLKVLGLNINSTCTLLLTWLSS